MNPRRGEAIGAAVRVILGVTWALTCVWVAADDPTDTPPPMRLTPPALLVAQAPAADAADPAQNPPPAAGDAANPAANADQGAAPAGDQPAAGGDQPAAAGEGATAQPPGADAEPATGETTSAGEQPGEGTEQTGPEPTATGQETGEQEEPWPPPPTDDQLTMRADRIYYYEGATGLQGNVEVVHRGITIHADVGEIDADHVWGQFRGNVTISGENYSTTVDILRVNFDTDEWQIGGGRLTVAPEYFEQGVLEPIYVHGGTVTAEPGGEPIHIEDVTLTTCSYEHPHYALTTEEATLRAENKLVLRRPALELFGHRILRYPWDLVLDTRSRENRFIPEVGQNSVEGFYAHLAYLYLAGNLGDGFLRLNLSQRRGIGLGADHYFDGAHQGELSLFYEPTQSSFSGRARDSYDISERLNSNLNVSMQQNTGYGGATTSLA
ncbi:MAG TPA: hypothetical protein VM283_05695, partial [Armatimonadota bacterium]|nr:hypothetical protein [Armatimonadota bacterium]